MIPTRAGPIPRSLWVALGLLLAVTAAGYHGVLDHPFLFDDAHTVAHNPAVHSLASIGEWFLSPYATSGIREYANYRPILIAGYALDRALWGPSPAGFHATNLAIHLVTVGLVFALGRRLSRDAWAAVCAAALFALHPINAEAVNYITARSSSLMTLGVLAALWADERAAARGSFAWRLLAYLLGAAALGVKEAAVVLPLLVIVCRRAAHGSTEGWADTLRHSVPWWVMIGLYLGFRTWLLWGLMEPAITGPGVTVGQNVLFALKIYAASLGHWLWPGGLAIDHAWPLWVMPEEGVVIVAALVVALAATAAMIRWDPSWGWCAAWFWIAILPVGALGFVTRVALYQDNRVYLAGVGLAWLGGQALAALLRLVGRRPAVRFAAAAGAVAAVGFAATVDAARTAVWSSRSALWDDVLGKYPTSLVAHNGKGLEAFGAGRFEEAREWFERAVRMSPGFAEGHKNLGVTFARIGDWHRAVGALEFSLSIDPRYLDARVNLGKVYEHVGRPDLALETYERVLRDDPGQAQVLARTAWLLAQAGRLPEATERYRRVVATGREDSNTMTEYGVLLLRLTRWEEAEQVFSTLATRDPGSYAAHFNLAAALDGRGAWDRAIEAYRRAATLNVTDPDPLFRIGVLFSKQERSEEAVSVYDQALARDPSHAPSHMNLAILAERVGDASRALGHYEAVLRWPASSPDDGVLRARARDAIAQLRGGAKARGLGG